MNRSEIPKNAEILSMTWAMKQKASGELLGRLNARGFEQLDGQPYYADIIAVPVTNPNTIRILLSLMCMNPKWIAEIVDLKGAFLQGEFENGECTDLRYQTSCFVLLQHSCEVYEGLRV